MRDRVPERGEASVSLASGREDALRGVAVALGVAARPALDRDVGDEGLECFGVRRRGDEGEEVGSVSEGVEECAETSAIRGRQDREQDRAREREAELQEVREDDPDQAREERITDR